jgi:hypothetical protein
MDVIRLDIKEVMFECLGRVCLAHDRVQWRALQAPLKTRIS